MSNCEALERALTQEKAENERLRQENIKLRAELATQQDVAYIAGGVTERTIEKVHELNVELEQIKAAFRRLEDLIIGAFFVAKADAVGSGKRLSDVLEVLKKVQEQQGIDDTVRVWWTVFKIQDAWARNVLKQQKQETITDDYSAAVTNITQTLDYIRIATLWDFGLIALSLLYGTSNDQRRVAQETIHELWAFDTTTVETLQKFKLEWLVKQTGFTRLGDLKYALMVARAYQKEGGSPEKFSAKVGIEERTLLNYRRAYDMLFNAAQELPATIKELLGDIEEQLALLPKD